MKELMTPGSRLHNQRLNRRDPLNTCNVTSICQALDILEYSKFPREDDLYDFIYHNKEVQEVVKTNDLCKRFPPERVHAILVLAINKWMGKQVARTESGITFEKFKEHIDNNEVVILSCRFPYYRGTPIDHMVTGHGYKEDGIFIADSYGCYTDLYTSREPTANTFMSVEDFQNYVKPDCIVVS